VACNATVVAGVVAGARGVAEVVAEESEARVELLEDDGLGLDFADLLGDDPVMGLSVLITIMTGIVRRPETDLFAISWITRRRCWIISMDSLWQTTSCSCFTTVVCEMEPTKLSEP